MDTAPTRKIWVESSIAGYYSSKETGSRWPIKHTATTLEYAYGYAYSKYWSRKPPDCSVVSILSHQLRSKYLNKQYY